MTQIPVKGSATAVFSRELKAYFTSPVAYIFIVIFLGLSGFFTFYISRFFEAGQADLRGFFHWHPWLYLFLIPAVAMRLWSDERRFYTIELILTLPISAVKIIFAKFFAAWAFIGISLLGTLPMVFTVLYLGDPDMGAIFCGYAGSFLMAGAFLSVGIMTSAVTRNQVVSFILSVSVCLFFLLTGFGPVTTALSGWAPGWLIRFVMEFSFLSHFYSIERGVIDLRDIIYYLSIIGFMLHVNAWVVQTRRI